MAIFQIPTAVQNAIADLVVDRLDAGSGAGRLRIYDGDDATLPPVNSAADGTLLVEITLDDPAYGAASSGAAALNDLDPTNWIADGTADYFRLVDSDNNLVAQGDVTVTAGSGTLKLSSVTAVTGSPVDVQSLTITMPNGV